MKKTLLLLPGPVSVAQPVLEAMARPMINHRGAEFGRMLDRVAKALQPVFGTAGDVFVLGSSGTGGLETAAVNLFGPGDVLLSCSIGVFGKRFASIAQTYGCTVETLDTPPGAALDTAALRARLEADGERRITGILLTHNETSTGAQNDMAAIAPIVRAHGAITLVDSVSGLGASPFKMDEWGYDVVVTASQKAFAAPPGVAMIAASKRAWKKIESNSVPRFYFDMRRAKEAGHDGMTPWTPPISIVFALDVALQRYHEHGMDAQFERHARYARAVRAALEALGFTIFSRPGAHSDTVVAAYPPEGIDAKALLERLRERYGVVLSGGQAEFAGKIVRFGTMGDVTEADLLGAVGAIELGLADLGVAANVGAGTAAAIESLGARVRVGV
ncbi:MAG TPA: alanine--glyoxylate aminotransferase family protein [Candidatus Acidoferrales bacterium]|jgi:aspartate aminotransferase-like enzyme|nr:alanine--glyoxylate aminotransferase family protein [Candidatus Acidoferrales bacterium]